MKEPPGREDKIKARGIVTVWLIALVVSLGLSGIAHGLTTLKIAGNLDRPVDIVNAGDGSGRLFFVLQHGLIVVYDGTKVLSKPFLDISSYVFCCGERGLLSLVFHPNYETNKYFYLNYTRLNGDVVVARYQVSADPNVAVRSSRLILLVIPHSTYSNHNGGKLRFGRDGYLYISIGDGGSAGDPNNNAQNLGTLLGKMLRINVNQGSPYSIPATNPFVGVTGAKKEIWAYGLRNSWRWSFDRLNGNMYIGDVGQNKWEEVDFQKASSPGGENYGWRIMEGKHCYNPPTNCNMTGLKLPILEYGHTNGACSITGGYVYRGSRISQIYGNYLYSDYCDGIIRAAKKVNGVWTVSNLLSTGKNISTFGEDESAELYFAHLADLTGEIYKIVP